MHGGGEPEELARCSTELKRAPRGGGPDRRPFEIHVISIDAYTARRRPRLEDLGVTDVIVGFRDPLHDPPGHPAARRKIRNLEWFAENVIAKAETSAVDRAAPSTWSSTITALPITPA